MAQGFADPFETGELILRDGGIEDPTRAGSSGLTRRNYAPDNRKVPPEPFLMDPFRDTDNEADPASTLATVGFAVDAQQATFIDGAGQVMPGSIIIQFTPPKWWGPASAYDVYAADTSDFDVDDFIRIGRIEGAAIGKGDSYVVTSLHLQRGRTYDVAIVPLNADGAGIDPVDAPRGTVALTSVGDVPPDTTGFGAVPDCCDIAFSWTGLPSTNNDVAYFEIRQGASFAAGALLARVPGWFASQVKVGVGQLAAALSAPNDQFHIKAFTGLGAESAAEASDTLTAAEIELLQAYCCVQTREILLTPGSDVIAVTSLSPTPVGIHPNFSVGQGNLGSGTGRTLRGGVLDSTIIANGNLWDYTIQLSDVALATEIITVTEAVRVAP